MGNDVLIALMIERRAAARRDFGKAGLMLQMTCCQCPHSKTDGLGKLRHKYMHTQTVNLHL